MSKAKIWAESYFQRLDSIIEELKKHPLIDHLSYIRFKGISDEEITAIEAGLSDEVYSNMDQGSEVPSFKIDAYMKAFYNISNGLNIAWDSHIVQSSLDNSRVITDADQDDFAVANNDLLQAEGFLSLLPLKNLISYADLDIYGDPRETRLGREMSNSGRHFTYLDFYNFYYDTCIALDPKGNTQNNFLYSGEDHSACYNDYKVSDFVIYMENLLANYFSVFLRSNAFYDTDAVAAFRDNDYEDIAKKIASENQYASIDDVLKYHVQDEELLEKFGDLDFLQEKPEAIYEKIEELLDVTLEDEL